MNNNYYLKTLDLYSRLCAIQIISLKSMIDQRLDLIWLQICLTGFNEEDYIITLVDGLLDNVEGCVSPIHTLCRHGSTRV